MDTIEVPIPIAIYRVVIGRGRYLMCLIFYYLKNIRIKQY